MQNTTKQNPVSNNDEGVVAIVSTITHGRWEILMTF